MILRSFSTLPLYLATLGTKTVPTVSTAQKYEIYVNTLEHLAAKRWS